jgi:hypothetical protein
MVASCSTFSLLVNPFYDFERAMKGLFCGVAICATLGPTLTGCRSEETHGITDIPTPPSPPSKEGGDAAPTPPRPRGPLASGLSIRELALFQGVKVSLAKTGVAVAKLNAPVVAGRPGLLRVYVELEPSWSPHEVTAELRMEAAGTAFPILADTKTMTDPSVDSNLASTFNFEISAERIVAGANYSVAIVEHSSAASSNGAPNTGAQYPAGNTFAPLPAQAGASALKIKIVPVQYDADGSGRIPDTSPAAIERYRLAVYGKYPTASVEISVREPFPYAQPISPGSNANWRGILEAIIALRLRDNAPKDVYYYGIFNPKATFQSFCDLGCLRGLSGRVEDPNDASQRASVGTGYAGQEATMPHEIGHAHGRAHADCGDLDPITVDPAFPYANARIGVWGYDLTKKEFIGPDVGSDMMAYCDNVWISDYTFTALFKRIATVSTASLTSKIVDRAPRVYRFLNVDGDGSLVWGDAVTIEGGLFTQPHAMSYLDANGRVLANTTGHYYAFGDIPGGYWLVTDGPLSAQKLVLHSIPTGAKMRREVARSKH